MRRKYCSTFCIRYCNCTSYHHVLTTGFLLLCIAKCGSSMLISSSTEHTPQLKNFLTNNSLTATVGNISVLPTPTSINLTTTIVKTDTKNTTVYKTVSPQDDEVHDEEIIEAVRNSLRLWKEGKLNKTHRNRVKRDEEVVCYGTDLGCFRDEGPFDYLDMLPSPPEEIGTKFLIYTKDNDPEVFSYFNYTKIGVNSSKFNSSLPTKIIVHGFGSTCLRMWANEMRNALLSVVDCNVICVDWENGAALPNYVKAAVNTRLVGKQLSLLIRWLVSENKGSISYEDFHLIGFSLGAHVAGFTGQELKNISRITGLDPAGPLFENYDKRVRLDATDAIFVDVIHSNGDSLLMGGLGSWEPIGHLDFYPNGGRVQKGCSNLFLGAFRDFIWSSPSNKESVTHQGNDSRNGKSLPAGENDGRSLCNHRRAYRFFTESVSPRCPYPSFSCDSYDKFLTGSCFQWDNQLVHSAHMGFYADEYLKTQVARTGKQLPMPPPPTNSKGSGNNNGKNFYLMTRDDEPFCANQYKIILESSPPLGIPISTYGGVEAIIINSQDDFNETFLLTQTHKDNMISGSVLQKLIVAHPAMSEPAKLILKYTAYKGWIYSGISRWSLDKVVITNAFGTSYSFCTRGLLLPSGISVTITLNKGICTVTNFPYRHPYLHSNIHHNNNNNNGHPHFPPHPMHHMPPSPMLRNELNETIPPSLPLPPTSPSSEIQPSGPGGNQQSSQTSNKTSSIPEFIDWSNDWHPIIMNKSSTPLDDCSTNNCTNLASEVNNEIDQNEKRSSRHLSPSPQPQQQLLLMPLSRAIEPRPVILRTSQHNNNHNNNNNNHNHNQNHVHHHPDAIEITREGRRLPLPSPTMATTTTIVTPYAFDNNHSQPQQHFIVYT